MVGASLASKTTTDSCSLNWTDLRSCLRHGLLVGLRADLMVDSMADSGSCLVRGLVRGLRLEVRWGLGALVVLGLCPCPCSGFAARYIGGGHPVLLDHLLGFFEGIAF